MSHWSEHNFDSLEDFSWRIATLKAFGWVEPVHHVDPLDQLLLVMCGKCPFVLSSVFLALDVSVCGALEEDSLDLGV